MVFLGQLLSGFIKIYMLILTLRIFLSWFRLPDNSFTRTLGTFTDPVLDLFRRICPLRIGFFDLSPMIPLLLLSLCDSMVTTLLINGRSFSLGYIVEIILYIVQFFVNIFSFVVAFSVIILLIVDIFMPYNIMPIVTMMKSFISPFTRWLQHHFWIKSNHSMRIYYIIILVGVAVVSTLLGWGISFLIVLSRGF
jgi:uncharacterized protein YggT (Ycf19 family)